MELLTQAEVDSYAKQEKNDSPGYKEYLGGFHFRNRMAAVAERSCKYSLGDLIEIGCYAGDTSIRLATVAKEFGRKLVCLDLWKPNDPDYKYEEVEKAFHKTMEPYKDITEVWKMDAHSPEAVKLIGSRKWAFALSDDGHLYEDHMTELMALLPVCDGIVVADDVHYHTHVTDAMRDSALANPGWKMLLGDGLREGYMIRG
jgi:predicted O-methyltransferase YrrM